MLNRLFVTSLKSIGLVSEGDNPDAEVVIYKARMDKRTFSREQRDALASKGQALPDGSFPIVNKGDLRNAVGAFGRAGNKAAARKHIIRRAKALGATDMLPDTWNVSKMTVKAESLPNTQKVNMDLSAIEDDQLRKSIEDEFAEKDTEVSDLETNLEKAIVKVAELEKGESKPEDDASDEVKVLIKERDDQIADLRKDLDDSVTKARIAEYVVKAKPLGVVVGKADEAGPILADIAEKAPESYAKLEPMLVTAAARINEGGLFKEYGAGEGEAEEDPIAAKEAWIEKNQKDDESAEHAAARFWDTSEGKRAKEELRS